jgi:hypothetical protein
MAGISAEGVSGFMTPDNDRRLEVTREKLRLLEQTFDEVKSDTSGTAHARELTLRSLKGLINQLKEEILRHEAHADDRAQTL